MKKNILSLVFLVLSGFFIFTCAKKKEQPLTQDPAYRSELVFSENFNGDLNNWYVGGKGKAEITGDSALILQLGSESNDLVLWSTRDFSGNFQIEYKIRFPDSSGFHAVFFCTKGAEGENILQMNPPPLEDFEQYIEKSLAGYQISCHMYDSVNRHLSTSRVRRNPGNLLLANAGSDPCTDNRDYVIDVMKIDNRIQYYVDGALVHDLRDRAGFGPTYYSGKIGFSIHGLAGVFNVLLDGIRVYKLIPR